ncbi:hypothetical protein VCRA2128O305_170092 [Vibrio crassostreae]|uniref:Uncharacterized protein n=1 Tax=Vibrio crassostreae TaxID=246167 RepID=A0A822MV86_9VIBR|nr:hypothetical protein VCRA2118O41_150015 [Vibrio crassostreae]CAK1769999.1 hypothetical protein VCRA2113O222_160033 [Vibrio crassostreae]CAK1772048.1 hypothetical protein VCRA2117O38_150021 [Vibrio crassostreae]CAK1772090.1 hypothetical protein VCRA2116O28_140140 [Vibrio crassostreae]CAK1773271.1 hypothetical protein VCRA2116O26_150021 [Vibrio crassostreae]
MSPSETVNKKQLIGVSIGDSKDLMWLKSLVQIKVEQGLVKLKLMVT